MPADTNPTSAPEPKSPRRTTKPRTTGRKPRVKAAGGVPPAPAVVLGTSPEEAVITAATAEHAGVVLDAVQARRDALLDSIAEAERRVAELRRQADEFADLKDLRHTLSTTRQQIDTASRQAETARKEASAVAGTFKAVTGQVESVRTDIEGLRQSADAVTATADRARSELDALGGRWQTLLNEISAIDAEALRTVDQLRAAVAEARCVFPAPPASTEVPPPLPRPLAPPGDLTTLPAVEPAPAEEVADGARDRLIRYLNDAGAVEREQYGLLQALIDATPDADLRAEFEGHRATGQAHREAVESRVRALGGEPAAGRGLLGTIVTRVWDVLQKPRDGGPDAVEDLLKALSAAEFEVGLYRAIHALARTAGDDETAALAAAHHDHGRAFADRLRACITPTAARAARRPKPGEPPGTSA